MTKTIQPRVEIPGRRRAVLGRVVISQNTARLSGSLSHLSSLASEASHALLSPLGTHATGHVKEKSDGVILLEAGQGAGQKGLSVLDDALKGRGHELAILDGGLELVQVTVGVHGDREGLLKGSHQKLHGWLYLLLRRVQTEHCRKGEERERGLLESCLGNKLGHTGS